MGFKLSEDLKKDINLLSSKYPTTEARILPALHLAQKDYGYISLEVVEIIAKELKVEPSRVQEVATFYTMYNKKPVGKYHIQICRNISCFLKGSKEILEVIKKELNIDIDQTTEDKKFTLTLVECLGSCGTAPVMQINDQYYENLTPDRVLSILKSLK